MLSAQNLLEAYAIGVFPMAESAVSDTLFWYDPPLRGVLPIGGIHVSRSLLRSLRRDGWTASLNHDFGAVVDGCADRDETWINASLRRLYDQLHMSGKAHSIEIWRDGALAGGVFGIALGGAFFGESMYSGYSNASKLALVWLSVHLTRAGFTLFDTQFLTPHLASLGGREISRSQYRACLAHSLSVPASFVFPPLLDRPALLQEIAHIS